MFARVSHFDVRSDRMQQPYWTIVERIMPALEMHHCYGGVLLLASSQQGKLLAVRQTSSPTRSTSDDRIIHNLNRTRKKALGSAG
jgi:hypothetical protein